MIHKCRKNKIVKFYCETLDKKNKKNQNIMVIKKKILKDEKELRCINY